MCSSRWRSSSRATTSPIADTLGIPNEDAQSFVFDATTLFERDKFSGYDRIEGGTRANVGFRYSGALRQWLDHQRPDRPVLPARRREFVRGARPRQCRRLFRPGNRYVRLRRPVRLRLAVRPVGFGQRPPRRADARNAPRRAQGRLYERRASRFRPNTPSSRRSRSTASTRTARETVARRARRVFTKTGACSARAPTISSRACWCSDAIGFAYDDECFTYLMTFAETPRPRHGGSDPEHRVQRLVPHAWRLRLGPRTRSTPRPMPSEASASRHSFRRIAKAWNGISQTAKVEDRNRTRCFR